MGLLRARYGAMGVIGVDGGLVQFIPVGIDDDVAQRIGSLPQGKGLLGALIEDPVPVRLEHLSSDPRSSGFPAHHPPMESFLGVPIRVGESVFGNLYLTDSLNGAFSADDEELAQALAATAAVAIENARLYEDSQYRARWSSSLAEVTRHLASTDDGSEIELLIDRVAELAGADLVSVVVADAGGEHLVVDQARGIGADDLLAMTFPVTGTVAGDAIVSGQPRVVDDMSALGNPGFQEQSLLREMMVVPFAVEGRAGGVLCVAHGPGGGVFTDRDVDMAMSFAGHISVAMERAAVKEARRQYAVLEDRARIARDLHDFVIQQLFGAGLNLQVIAGGADPVTAKGIGEQIRAIDGAIAQIRQSIFAMQRDPSSSSVSLRARVLEIVDQVSEGAVRPRASFLGPVDLVAGASLTDDIAAVVTEAVTNAVKHSEASMIEVVVNAAAGQITVEVADDGKGFESPEHVSGLANLRTRAESYGGTFDVGSNGGRGTRVVWSVPA
ncbi:MAG: GAF domain-containing protein [Nocardioides sp.]|nr:GAF domain-containing protein [Nocardioides sp.]